MLESKNSTRFWNIYKSDCSDILYRISDIISEFLICLNQKILLVFGTFINQTALIYYIYILYQNFSCKTRCIIKKIRVEENLNKVVVERWVYGICNNG